ncbi:VOC family protein [Paucibacter sp. PLA-PC-4]|uniref:VOC family protein n=1 Tax=Paucibacter sp. PLA-PC-4 TaxID=2993655 RepID=UPI0022489032|nr:VOC family protein [Paucibacter sp. PLA-PC-4]MCX2860961.1 VOC family protein [Paucibacter sp. PLA-PC-4]
MKVSAVRVFVRDLVSAQVFYQQALGLKLKHGDAGAAYRVFDAGSADLVLECVASDAPQEEQALVGRFTGLSFAVSDIRARHTELSAAGVPFSGAPEQQPWGGWLATLVDPAGNQLQLVQYPG